MIYISMKKMLRICYGREVLLKLDGRKEISNSCRPQKVMRSEFNKSSNSIENDTSSKHDKGRDKTMSCYFCQLKGHRMTHCKKFMEFLHSKGLNLPAPDSQSPDACWFCKEAGHRLYKCQILIDLCASVGVNWNKKPDRSNQQSQKWRKSK